MAELVDQPTNAPTRKVTAGGIGGALVVIIALIYKYAFGGELPAELVAPLTAIIAFGFAYMVKEKAPEVELDKAA